MAALRTLRNHSADGGSIHKDDEKADDRDLHNEQQENNALSNSQNTDQKNLESGPDQSALYLTSSDALAQIRAHPTSPVPIYITFAPSRPAIDPANPRAWPRRKKWFITIFVSTLNVLTCLVAGGYSSGAEGIGRDLQLSTEAVTLGLSMYVLGFAIGPVLLAPLSEYCGRNPVYVLSWGVLVALQAPMATAQAGAGGIVNVVLVRFLAGFAGSAPLTNTGGTVSDLWARDESGWAMMVYGFSSTFGPPFALVVSGYVVLQMGWRWLFWVFMIIVGAFWILMILFLPETRHSTILEKKVKHVRKVLRKEGLQNCEAFAQLSDSHNKGEKRSLHTLFAINLTRPFRFLFTEPITLGAAAYNAFIYGIVYLFNESLPLVFGPGGHGFNTGEQGLAFLGLAIGVFIAACFHPLQERYYRKRVAQNGGKGVPEARMFQAQFGAFLLPISLFWFAWTSYPSVHWIVPIIGSSLFGAGIYIVILAVLNYVVDSYGSYCASALAGVILARNIVGAGFPLFARQMYTTLGNEWASSLLGFLSLLFVPIPIWWFYRGEQLRLRSPWAREHFDQSELEDTPH